MAKRKIKALDLEIRLSDKKGEDFICVTDIAKFNSSEPEQVVRNYFRNKGNIDFLGAWEKLHNEHFNYVEFDAIRAGVGSANFTLSAKEWIERTGAMGIKATAGRFGGTFPKAKGNLRDNATALQLLVLASLEVSNAALIEQGLPKPERILRLSKKAQERMLLLVDSASGQELAKHLEPSAEVRQLGASQEEE